MVDKVKKIIEEIENLTVVELNELIKQLEEKFGSVIITMPTQDQAVEVSRKESEPATVKVTLIDSGANKIQVIKALREINPNISLKEAKDIVDNPPQVIKENINIAEANKIKEKIENAGGKIEIK